MGAVQAALATLRRCQAGLARDVTAEERARLLALHDEALRLLEEGSERRRLGTRALARRVAKLERQLAHMEPAARSAAIRERLGVSKSHYYRLRSPDNAGLADGPMEL